MSLTGVISSFATGTYTVTRTAVGSLTAGRYTAGASSTFPITASIQPLRGRDLQVLAEGQSAEESRVVYTTTELRTRTPSVEPDTIADGAETWEVFRVEHWPVLDGGHYRAYVSRRPVP